MGIGLMSVLILTFLINLPFGYWRKKTKKMSKEWFIAVHSPVPLIFLLRILAKASPLHIPLFVAAFFSGQFAGGKIREKLERKYTLTKCMIMDIYRIIS